MNILFLTLPVIEKIDTPSIYMDLMKTFAEHGHRVYIVSPLEKKYGRDTYAERSADGMITLIRCRTGNLFNVGMIEKGISQVMLSGAYAKAIHDFITDPADGSEAVKPDLLLYSTPPITIAGVIAKMKKRTGAHTYLLLKDIFPQNAVDIGLLPEHGIRGLITGHFKRQEKKLYLISDYIGCMSPANVEYLLKHNGCLDPKRVEVCPNSIRLEKAEDGTLTEGNVQRRVNDAINPKMKAAMFTRFGIPASTVTFLYGGNLGKPQGIPYLLECVEACRDIPGMHFVICGKGTEAGLIERFIEDKKPCNLTLIPGLPHDEYEQLAGACDVGLIFLDHRFTIPNFPSRMLSYMAAGKPMLFATDPNTDAGRIAEAGGFGTATLSNDTESFKRAARELLDEEKRQQMGIKGRMYLEQNYDAAGGYEIIMRHFT